MSSQPEAAEKEATQEDYDWRLVKRGDAVTLDLSSKYQDFEGPMLTLLTRTIGEALIKVGTMFLQSRIEGDDEEDEYWDD